MKYLLNNNDIEGAKYGRIIRQQEKIFVKNFPNNNDFDYVDLGLPSGNLWATCNVGASSPEEIGLYFAWGDTQGYTAEQVGTAEGKKSFNADWSDYKFSGERFNSGISLYGGPTVSANSQFNKYCNNISFGYNDFIDNKLVLDLEDDAAHVSMGGGWSIPSREDYEELLSSTFSIWTELNGVYGIKLINKSDENKHIFIPNCNGVKNGEILPISQYDTYLRCNSVMENDCRESIGFYCYNSSFVKFTEAGVGYSRYMGYPVRGVINI